ncbi:wnt inhibitory factor 1 [Lethenteron reissneri]|uniref:wnt inhibitory factor 1 n=1 Tax=Lethenteron reissneri TaxID=7753 RepID=UPI002AB6D772|nr:wnt inhibitory factor 1 [Lethenteron reissneri]
MGPLWAMVALTVVVVCGAPGIHAGPMMSQDPLALWIDATQARDLIGLEENIYIVSDGKMAPFTHDFKRAQQRMPAIPSTIPSINFTWQAARESEYFYEFQLMRSLDEDIMSHPVVNIPALGTIPNEPSVVQVSFPCLASQEGVAAFKAIVQIINQDGDIVLSTPENAIFFKVCKKAGCKEGCMNGGVCTDRDTCDCPDGFFGASCEKALCAPRCMNGGLCITPGLCLCPPGFSGVYCENANCSNSCLNGGTCHHHGKCVCPPGFDGSHCEHSKCSPPCQNRGKCVGTNRCKCSKGYEGDHCARPVCWSGCAPHGSCVAPRVCRCEEGWHGQLCDKRASMGPHKFGGRKKALPPPPPPAKVLPEDDTPSDSNYIW